MRNFERTSMFSACAIYMDKDPLKAFIINFSRMGAMVTTQCNLKPKDFISLAYKNEKNQLVRILTYVVYCKEKSPYYVAGLQFVGIESKN